VGLPTKDPCIFSRPYPNIEALIRFAGRRSHIFSQQHHRRQQDAQILRRRGSARRGASHFLRMTVVPDTVMRSELTVRSTEPTNPEQSHPSAALYLLSSWRKWSPARLARDSRRRTYAFPPQTSGPDQRNWSSSCSDGSAPVLSEVEGTRPGQAKLDKPSPTPAQNRACSRQTDIALPRCHPEEVESRAPSAGLPTKDLCISAQARGPGTNAIGGLV
jgi:hypothetical protein